VTQDSGTPTHTIPRLVQMAASVNQELQELILQTLEMKGSIADSSKLVLPSQPASPLDQQVAQAVLTSLASRHVFLHTSQKIRLLSY